MSHIPVSPQFKSLLNNTFEIHRRDGASDGQGGFHLTYSPIATGVIGRIHPKSTGIGEKNLGDRWDAIVTHQCFFQVGVDVRRDDRIVLTRSPEINYRVIDVREPSLGSHHFEVDCEQIQLKEPTNNA